jgi:hypothetical protein
MGSLKLAWQKRYGDAWEERWNAWRKKMSDATSGDKNPMHGRHDHVHGLQRYAREKTGKSLEEVHGHELAAKIRQRRSETARGSNNPAYGKVYTNGGKSVKGYYKGLFFRSLLEYSFMKHLEVLSVNLHADVDYECFQVHFVHEGRDRTYKPDFYVRSHNTVYEIKPAYVLKKVPALQTAKWNAMREQLNLRGIEFRVMTDADFPKIAFDLARQDQDVIWKEETFKYFKGNA